MQTLPAELRYSIFELLAHSLNFYSPHPDPRNTPNVLGFLTACRLFHTEAAPLVLSNATFHCRATEHVVDLLSSFTKEQISLIRHLTFRGTPFPLYLNPDYYTTHRFETALQLFPGLQLDTFVVRDPYHGSDVCEDGWGHIASYDNVEQMVIVGKGFKELQYIVANPAFLWLEPFESWHKNRPPQLLTWGALIRDRDGVESGACVEIYIANSDAAGIPGAALSDSTRESFNPEAFRDWKDIPEREVLVITKRGSNCNYVECSSTLPPKVKALFESKSWEQIKAEGLVLKTEEDPTSHLLACPDSRAHL